MYGKTYASDCSVQTGSGGEFQGILYESSHQRKYSELMQLQVELIFEIISVMIEAS